MENLVDIEKWVLEYWDEIIVFFIKVGKKVIIFVYGNMIRVLMQYLDNILFDGIVNLNIFISVLFVYEFDDNLKFFRYYYLGIDGEIFIYIFFL